MGTYTYLPTCITMKMQTVQNGKFNHSGKGKWVENRNTFDSIRYCTDLFEL